MKYIDRLVEEDLVREKQILDYISGLLMRRNTQQDDIEEDRYDNKRKMVLKDKVREEETVLLQKNS